MNTEQRYKFHRAARYLLAVPIVFLLAWWTAALILEVLPLDGALRIAVFIAIFHIKTQRKNRYEPIFKDYRRHCLLEHPCTIRCGTPHNGVSKTLYELLLSIA